MSIYTLRPLAYFVFAAFLLGCSSGKKALERGNYAEAIQKAVNRLRQTPKNNKARHTLRKGYPLAISFYKNKINQDKLSASPRKWENVLYNYRILNQMHDDIQRCPACLDVLTNVQNFQREESEARQKAAYARFKMGQEHLNKGGRQNAKEAYNHFLATKNLLSSYPNVDQAIMEAKEAATIRVIVEKVPVYSQRYRISDEYFSNKMFEFLQQNRRMSNFVQFYTTTEAVSQQLKEPDHVIRMQFDDFEVGRTLITKNTESVTKDSVVVGSVKVEGENKNVYGTVKAKFTTYTKTVKSSGVLDLKIYDAQTKQLVSQEKFRGDFVWEAIWGNYQGDERALTDEQLEACELEEVSPPNPESLFIEFSKPIYDRVTSYLRNFYKDY